MSELNIDVAEPRGDDDESARGDGAVDVVTAHIAVAQIVERDFGSLCPFEPQNKFMTTMPQFNNAALFCLKIYGGPGCIGRMKGRRNPERREKVDRDQPNHVRIVKRKPIRSGSESSIASFGISAAYRAPCWVSFLPLSELGHYLLMDPIT